MSESDHTLLRHSGRVAGVSEAACVGFYHPARSGHQERVSASLVKFVEGVEPHLSRWIELAAPRVASELNFDLIVRVLRHDEVAAGGDTSVDRLCDAIASASCKPYVPHRLRKKRPTRPLEELAGKAARAAEIDGVLRFDGSSINDDARILVVDSLLWTGATVEAVARAIHEQLPRATVVAFVLTRADATSSNAHLNPDYFEGTSNDPAGAPVKPKRVSARERKEPAAPQQQAADAAPIPAPLPARRFRIRASTALIGGMAVVFLIIGALVPLRSDRKPPDMPDPLVEPLEINPPETAEAVPATAPVRPRQADEPSYPRGLVIVPSAGLRTSASLDARMVGKASLRSGEQVSILKRHRPDVGPSWVQVKTKSGKVGWVFASVVKEKKNRM